MFKLKNIREYRKLKRISQEDLGWEIGLGQQAVSLIELGEYNNIIKLATLIKIAEVLKVNLEDILEVKL